MAQKTVHVFQIDHNSESDDTAYSGTFSCKKLSVRDYSKIQVEKSRLNGGMHHDPEKPGYGVSEDTDGLNHMFAHLTVALTNSPDWWDLDTIGDMELVTKVYAEVATFEATFRNRGRVTDGSGAEEGTSTGSGSDSGGDASTVVGEKVSAALQP